MERKKENYLFSFSNTTVLENMMEPMKLLELLSFIKLWDTGSV